MEAIHKLLDDVLREALDVVRTHKAKIYTIAFYHDHESRAVSVCVDTEASSHRFVVAANERYQVDFWRGVETGDLEDAENWSANTGRSLSLGDFAFVNLGRRDLPRGKQDKNFYIALMKAMRRREKEILKLAVARDRLLCCCSGPADEVAFMWSVSRSAKRK